MDIEKVIANLGDQFSPDEVALIEELLRKYYGTAPDAQVLEEIGLALAIHRRRSQG